MGGRRQPRVSCGFHQEMVWDEECSSLIKGPRLIWLHVVGSEKCGVWVYDGRDLGLLLFLFAQSSSAPRAVASEGADLQKRRERKVPQGWGVGRSAAWKPRQSVETTFYTPRVRCGNGGLILFTEDGILFRCKRPVARWAPRPFTVPVFAPGVETGAL